MTGFYDTSFEAFMCRLFKKKNDEHEQGIGLRIEVVKRVLSLFPRLDGIKRRYAKKDMQMQHRFEIAKDLYLCMGKSVFITFLFHKYDRSRLIICPFSVSFCTHFVGTKAGSNFNIIITSTSFSKTFELRLIKD